MDLPSTSSRTDQDPNALNTLLGALDSIAQLHPRTRAIIRLTQQIYAIRLQARRSPVDDQTRKFFIAIKRTVDLLQDVIKVDDEFNVLSSIIDDMKENLNRSIELLNSVADPTVRSDVVGEECNKMIQTLDEGHRLLSTKLKLHTALVTARKDRMDEDARNYAVELQILRALWEMKFRNDASQAICIRGTDLLASKSIDMLQKAPGEELAIIWVHGMAGTGKSTIANTVAADMKSKGDAVVHVSFEGDRPRRGTVISTLATHLAHSDYEIRSEICAAVRARPGVIDGALEDQLKYLVLDPLKNVAQKLTNPVFIIMDALDQYGDMIERRKMLSLISTNFTELPPQFRFLITSRREPDIEHAFSQNPKIKALSLEHVEPGDRLEHIRIYVTHEMSHIRALHRLNSTWPGNENIEMMVLKSEGLFIWASRLVEFVMQSTYPEQSLESILTSQESYKILGFDAFYEAILTTRKGWMAGLAPRFQSIACVALFNHTPAGLTDHEIDVLLDLSEHDSCQFLLRSFCSLFEYLPGNPIRPLHSSLREYLVRNSNNDAPWSLHNTDPHQCLTICCLRVMKKYFRCQGAEGVVDPTSAMKYASRNWFHHLSKAPFPDETIEAELKSFMKEDVFNWAQREVSTEDGRAVIIQFRDIKLDENVEPLAQIQGLQRLLCSEFSNELLEDRHVFFEKLRREILQHAEMAL